MSSRFLEGQQPYVLGAKGCDQTAPELSKIVPYNAFHLDVYILGHLYQREFLDVRDPWALLLIRWLTAISIRNTTT